MQVSDNFDDVRKKRLNELAQQRTSSSAPVMSVPESTSRSVVPPKSPSKPATRVSRMNCYLHLCRLQTAFSII